MPESGSSSMYHVYPKKNIKNLYYSYCYTHALTHTILYCANHLFSYNSFAILISQLRPDLDLKILTATRFVTENLGINRTVATPLGVEKSQLQLHLPLIERISRDVNLSILSLTEQIPFKIKTLLYLCTTHLVF